MELKNCTNSSVKNFNKVEVFNKYNVLTPVHLLDIEVVVDNKKITIGNLITNLFETIDLLEQKLETLKEENNKINAKIVFALKTIDDKIKREGVI